jgi:predicted branched-subunit amino acid permease
MSDQEPIIGIIATAIIINLRLLFYGAALKNMFKLNSTQKLIWSHFILDESFIATSVAKNQLERTSNTKIDTKFIFLFSGITLSTIWNIATVLGFVLFSSLEDLITFPSNFIIAASFVGFLGVHWSNYPNDRKLLITIGSLSFILGFVFSSSDLIVILMVAGVIFNMFMLNLNRDK